MRDALVLQRIKNLKNLRSIGINQYRNACSVSDSSQDITDKYGQLTAKELAAKKYSCSIAERVIALRSFGKVAFAHIQDHSGRVQIYVKKEIFGRIGTLPIF